jgi:hypothetical protein
MYELDLVLKMNTKPVASALMKSMSPSVADDEPKLMI